MVYIRFTLTVTKPKITSSRIHRERRSTHANKFQMPETTSSSNIRPRLAWRQHYSPCRVMLNSCLCSWVLHRQWILLIGSVPKGA